jgi:hypothetical protein
VYFSKFIRFSLGPYGAGHDQAPGGGLPILMWGEITTVEGVRPARLAKESGRR